MKLQYWVGPLTSRQNPDATLPIALAVTHFPNETRSTAGPYIATCPAALGAAVESSSRDGVGTVSVRAARRRVEALRAGVGERKRLGSRFGRGPVTLSQHLPDLISTTAAEDHDQSPQVVGSLEKAGRTNSCALNWPLNLACPLKYTNS